MSKKNEFVNEFKLQATSLAQIIARCEELEDIYFDRGYNSGGADAITDADISSTGLTAAQVGSLITLGQQIVNFRDNAAVTTGDYGATLNVARNDL